MTIDRQKTLNTIKTLIANKYVNVEPQLYAEWAAAFDRLAPALLTASPLDFQKRVHSALAALKRATLPF